MLSLGRQISLLGRRRDAARDRERVLRSFADWRRELAALPPPRPRGKTLLVIRLDDIGDYLLFRNQLAMYRHSPRWRDHRITLLGNAAWKDLLTLLDADAVDDTLWVNKNRYLQHADDRQEVWRQLRDRGFETVITPSRTRPLLLDDLCMLAAAPLRSLGCVNTNVHATWNRLSDGLYESLFEGSGSLMHEFRFNAEFAQWACGICYSGVRPVIERRFDPPIVGPYVICFIGASTRSKRWPVNRWLDLIALHRRHFSGKLVLAGNGKAELEMARIIRHRTGVESIVGTVSLTELLGWVAGAEAVVTNDTMTAHMGVSFDRPTVIIANGINYMRFSEYDNTSTLHVATVYPEVVNRRRRRIGDGPYAYSETVTADIASIKADTVFTELQRLLR
jgi:ADP-heptose:LPS heptosyltransferase